jgi:hypothetical protein
VLTRLPAGLAVTPAIAAGVLGRRFPDQPLRLPDGRRDELLEELSGLGIGGGASYDALVALEAQAHGRLLLSLDRRAQATYQRLGVPFRAVAAGGVASG